MVPLLLFLLGLLLGPCVNKFVDTFGWEVRRRSLWRPGAVGITLFCGLMLAGLYCWEVEYGMVSNRPGDPREVESVARLLAEPPSVDSRIFDPGRRQDDVHRFLVHAVLFLLLLAATRIDFEDMIIPDILTVSGTLFALAAVFLMPGVLLPGSEYLDSGFLAGGQPGDRFDPDGLGFSLLIPSRLLWFTPVDLKPPGGIPFDFASISPGMVVLALLLWYGWCFAMMNRLWRGRLGFRLAWLVFWRRLRRCPTTKQYMALALLGTLLIPAALLYGDDVRAQALFSSLVGMAAGGGIIWAVRIIGSAAAGREAMGFGDVTFMAMIGAFIGWQPCIPIFFLAPFAGVVIGIIGFLCGRGSAIPYGPYLALATVLVVLFWPSIWAVSECFYGIPGLVPLGMVLCLLLLGLLLYLWRCIRERLFSM